MIAVRTATLDDLYRIMSERGVRHQSLDEALTALQRQIDKLGKKEGGAEREMAGILWRLYCSLSQLKQALPESAAQQLK